VGGLEKENLTGNVSYDPENHKLMSELREQKVMNVRDSITVPEVFGAPEGDVLVVAWGSTFGAVRSATNHLHQDGLKVAHLHLRHIWPLPHGLDEIFARYKRVLVPELNMGQLSRLLRSEYAGVEFVKQNKVMGKPLRASEVRAKMHQMLEEVS
jgi:2-oxoglutarate/2-oxoacid ferredoxin oxidoreductase subunit alpha